MLILVLNKYTDYCIHCNYLKIICNISYKAQLCILYKIK